MYLLYVLWKTYQTLITKESAMPIRNKIQTMSNEVFRRMHNTKHNISWNIKVDILEKFMSELKSSGYSERDRCEILKSGIRRYEVLKKKEEQGERPFFGNKNFLMLNRNDEKKKNSGSWFKEKQNKFTTVFLYPQSLIVYCESVINSKRKSPCY